MPTAHRRSGCQHCCKDCLSIAQRAVNLQTLSLSRILQLTQLINARHGATKPHNTIQAEKSAAKLWKVGAAWPVPLFLWRP